ncbi:MAG: glycosyltransferase family 39 protein [Planctomycetes bacterium]|nr:glycosyltransferase family 39 protein [Planctomycetota bacterium]
MSDSEKLIVPIPAYKQAIIPVVVVILALVPFLDKAIHMDDALFIWSAKHIQENPADFYGFTVNWYGHDQPMSEVVKNPPLTSYYIALVGSLFGYGETVLHIAFLFPAIAVALGTYHLAKQFCSLPMLAALAAVLTPGFLVSSANIMCDTMMLAFWVWAILFWMQGLKANKPLSLLFAALLIAASALTKYFGIALLPLLFAYSFMQKRKLGTWALFLLVPIAVLVFYQWATYILYGRGLLLDAAAYATKYRWIKSAEFFSKPIAGLAFTGGCIITVLFYAPLLWSRKTLSWGLLLVLSFVLLFAFVKNTGGFSAMGTAVNPGWGFIIQLAIMVVVGLSVLALAIADFWKCRNAESILLLFWVLGTFAFASFINWAVNVRSILPMVPVVGILLMRQIERCKIKLQMKQLILPLVPVLILTMSVCWADYTWAGTARNASVEIGERFKSSKVSVWFQGHWGFQYYMQAQGGRAFDFKRTVPLPADIIIIPSNNTNLIALPEDKVYPSEALQFAPLRWLTTMDSSRGASFYANKGLLLPFVITPVGLEQYYIFIVKGQKTE